MNFYKSSLPSTCASLQFLSSVWLRLFHKTQFEKKMDSLQYIFLGFFLQNENSSREYPNEFHQN